VRGFVAEIRRAGGRAADLTRQLLAFSRQQDLRFEPVDVNEVVTSSETFLRRLLGEDVQLTVETAVDLPAAIADPGQLVQLVLNLSVNARDAMPNGGALRIATSLADLSDEEAAELETGAGRHVVLSVADEGEGIDPSVRERIFEPFFTTKGSRDGTGLGLSTVHGIVRQLGGAVRCQSSLGVGTTFTVYLPATDDAVAEGNAAAAPSGGTETVLLVEDEPILREVVAMMLGELGYDGIVATGPREALDLLAAGAKIDVLLTDVVMPEINGCELALEVAKIAPHIRVVYTSGYTGDVVLERGVLAERDAFLQKPFTLAELDERLREVLDCAR
jgi:CheY-like chemotaxis protein